VQTQPSLTLHRYASAMFSIPLPLEDAAPVDVMASLAEARDLPLIELWRWRIAQHHRDRYAGVPISKFPEDLRTYERVIWERQPRVVVEVGVQHGGSTLWLRDRLFDFQRYRCGPAPWVIGIDVDLSAARANFADLPPEATAAIELLEGDVNDGTMLSEIRDRIPPEAEVLVIEDAAHDHRTTRSALAGLAPLVKPGGFYMVEDTCVDVEALRVIPEWPRGAGLALDQWLANDPLGRCFRRRPDLQCYGITCHPGGLIQRLPDP
jgi:cephalosporin hydroxylase